MTFCTLPASIFTPSGHFDNIIASIKRHSRRFLEQLFAETGGLTVVLGALEGDMVVICDVIGPKAAPWNFN